MQRDETDVEKVPGAQSRQASFPGEEYVEAGQSSHAVDDGEVDAVPAAQGVHGVAPVEDVPAAQGVQMPPCSDPSPAGHGVSHT